jgi:hypothetical protein
MHILDIGDTINKLFNENNGAHQNNSLANLAKNR